LHQARLRLKVVVGCALCAFVLALGQLWSIPLRYGGGRLAQQNFPEVLAYQPSRANITDRNGELLATNLVTYSLYADPTEVLDPAETAEKLHGVLTDLSVAETAEKLTDTNKRFLWLRRNLTPQQFDAINRLGLPGIDCQREERRVYPLGRVAAHVLGYTDTDANGVAGIEKKLDSVLKTDREPLALSLDLRLQHIMAEELRQRVEMFSALGAAGMVLDIHTGEILAFVSLPDFDPNRPENANPNAMFNRVSLGIYEMGSTLKVMNTAIALDAGTAKPTTLFDAINPIKVGRFTIEDYKGKNKMLSMTEVLQYSSNLGSARMAMAFGGSVQQRYLKAFGLLNRPVLEIPEIGEPLVPRPWRDVTTMTVSFGHGLSVSAVQLAGAVAAAVNGGVYRPLTLLRREQVPQGVAVIRPETSKAVAKMLYDVVEGGTGNHAVVPGYFVGGKTGSAEKLTNGRYKERKLLSSFVGVFPMYAPRYLVLAVVDEPKGIAATHGYATGGWVAAPAVAAVVQRMAPLLGITPKEAVSPEVVTVLGLPKQPEIKEETVADR
jgi:cell division protein FtsI (penicillin-binding protein 3)